MVAVADSLVELVAPPPLPETLGENAWDVIDQAAGEGDFWDMLTPKSAYHPYSAAGTIRART